ncbi:MAG: hypothetical protein H7A06_08945 [Pseudomonadales bacterium]|nr:hypothetical protein [Pseudomonadales bacterium]
MMKMMRVCRQRVVLLAMSGVLISACGTTLPEPNPQGRHLQVPELVEEGRGIPGIVQSSSTALLPEPSAQETPELLSVVVQDVPVRELLFAIARDAGVNVDVNPNVLGVVSLNVVDRTLPQILDRIGRQIDIRWRIDPISGLEVEADTPFLKTYQVDYVNVARESTTDFTATSAFGSVGGADSGGTGSNNSTAALRQTSTNRFWETLNANLLAIMGEAGGGEADQGSVNVISNVENGIVLVRGTSRQHNEIQRFLDFVRSRSLAQVLIEATIVEVELSDQYQSGVDWAVIGRDSGQLDFVQSLNGLNLTESPVSTLTLDRSAGPDALATSMRMLSQFGNLRVLSSPKLMALNNQTAMLRVVDNRVFFTLDVQAGTPATVNGPGTPPTYTSEINTIPVGFVMGVTPQIGEGDQVTLNVRPTISRILRYVNDPNPTLNSNNVVNGIPEVQIREMESILKVYSGQIAVLGGLMQDSIDDQTSGLPGLSRLPGVGGLFSYKEEVAKKTELIVFIRPVVIKDASLDSDLSPYRDFLSDIDVNSDGFMTSRFTEDNDGR